MKEMCNKHNIKQLFTSAYNPTENSISERVNATIGTFLRTNGKIITKQTIKDIEQAINNVHNTALGTSPY
jgi:aspartate/tyrosine/aromatic aminotransferase